MEGQIQPAFPRETPAPTCAASITTTSAPPRASSHAHARPTTPAPTTATVDVPVLTRVTLGGRRGDDDEAVFEPDAANLGEDVRVGQGRVVPRGRLNAALARSYSTTSASELCAEG